MVGIQETIKKGKGKTHIKGWVYRIRKGKNLIFLIMRDSKNIIQCVVEKEKVSENIWKDAEKILTESAVEIDGKVSKDDRAPTGYEIKVEKLNVVHFSEVFPIAKDLSTEFLADNRHLWLRSRKMNAIMKIRSKVFGAIHDYFRSNDYYEFQSPIFQATQGEGGSTMFTVPYFGKELYLAQTWQLYAEAAIFSLEKIYCIAPSFRAEKSVTSRHLTEYWHAEMEILWNTFDDLQDEAEGLLRNIVKLVLKDCKEELEILKRDTKKLEATAKKKFPRITYTEALKILDKKCKLKVKWGKDLRTIEEDKLGELYDTPIIVTRYPKEVKAFYMKEDPEDNKVVLGFDVIGPDGYGELFGASQRETDVELLKERLTKEGEDLNNYEYYFDTRRYGSVPHGGFGMGVERVISWICGLDTIKDAIPFPRNPTRFTP
ncbi:asparagine--tRNA ligase [archaeon]|jgi:asparaginyl-tRNA synthetase|nr:asparagine--tRNA ligase [archaeon]MBT4397244.1 asparagine--tRNA ligase [archaeon]MBT4440624.1 asparagine--tRNA ligase [archaeon]